MVPHQDQVGVNVATASATDKRVSAGNTETVPDKSWSLEQLAEFVKTRLSVGDQHESDADAAEERLKFLRRTSVLQYFRAGRALCMVRDRLKETQDWSKWQKDHAFSRKTVQTAIKIYEKGRTEERVSTYTLAQAKAKWCYDQPKDKGVAKSEQAPRPVPAATLSTGCLAPSGDSDVIIALDTLIKQLQSVKSRSFSPEQRQHVSQQLD